MISARGIVFIALASAAAMALAQGPLGRATWRYYRAGNTGIQGDYCDALWIGPDDDPWIGGYVPSFEEGGLAKLLRSENRWIGVSNVDYPAIGDPNDTGVSRISDIAADAAGNLWMATGRGGLKFNPSLGPASLRRFDARNSGIMGGWSTGVELAPDGTVWFSAYGTSWGSQGLARYNPATNAWVRFNPYGEGSLAIQPRPSSGYYVWARNYLTGRPARYDSVSGAWTDYQATTGSPGGLVGKGCTDAAGNTWMLRLTGNSDALRTLDCRRPDGTWIGVPALTGEIWAFRAFGNLQALAVDGSSVAWRFNGTSWQSLGQWRSGSYTSDIGMDSAGNVWVCGTGGAAVRNAQTGVWQRHRLTNNGNIDYWNNDLALVPSGGIYACSNGAPGIGGMVHFDGERWINFNNSTHGLGFAWPFQSDNARALTVRADGRVAVNPMYAGTYEWNGSTWTNLRGTSTVVGYTEDSLSRLWALGEYFNLAYHNGTGWVQVGITAWGSEIERDPDRAGTVWATTGHEIKRTDGSYSFSRQIGDFPELTTQSDTFSGLAVGRNGVAWVGCTVMLGAGGSGGGLIRLDANTGAYTMYRYEAGWPFPGKYVSPIAVTPDGRVWMIYVNTYQYFDGGLCWFDGTRVGVFPGPVDGAPQWGGPPHTQIYDAEVRSIQNGYELWLSCASRGIAVLTVRRPGTIEVAP